MHTARIDHMVITVSMPEQSGSLQQALAEHRFPVAILAAALREHQDAQVTMIAGMAQHRLPLFFQLVRQHAGIADRPNGACGEDGRAAARALSRTRLAGTIEMDHVIEVRIGCATSYVVPVRDYLEMPSP